jgi:ABC-type uncharacterized transport system permease subunit
MTEALHLFASALYAAAAMLGVQSLRRGGETRRVAWALWGGVVLHGGGFVALHGREPAVPLESFPAALSLIGWLIPLSHLVAFRTARVRGVGTWVAAAASVFTGVAGAGLFWLDGSGPQAPSQSPTWSHAHVILSSLGFSMLTLTSVAGIAYLTKQRALKRNQAARFGLPSLESLDRMEHVTLSLGFLLLTFGILTGLVWGAGRGDRLWTFHSVSLVIAWGVYLVPIGLRLLSNQHGDRPARLVVAGFGLLAFSYVGVRILGLSA